MKQGLLFLFGTVLCGIFTYFVYGYISPDIAQRPAAEKDDVRVIAQKAISTHYLQRKIEQKQINERVEDLKQQNDRLQARLREISESLNHQGETLEGLLNPSEIFNNPEIASDVLDAAEVVLYFALPKRRNPFHARIGYQDGKLLVQVPLNYLLRDSEANGEVSTMRLKLLEALMDRLAEKWKFSSMSFFGNHANSEKLIAGIEQKLLVTVSRNGEEPAPFQVRKHGPLVQLQLERNVSVTRSKASL